MSDDPMLSVTVSWEKVGNQATGFFVREVVEQYGNYTLFGPMPADQVEAFISQRKKFFEMMVDLSKKVADLARQVV